MMSYWTQVHEEPHVIGVALICGKGDQLARTTSGELRTHFRVTVFSGGCAMDVKDSLRLCIYVFHRFDALDAVIRVVAVVFAG